MKILMSTLNAIFANSSWNTVWHNLWCFLSILLRWSYKMKNFIQKSIWKWIGGETTIKGGLLRLTAVQNFYHSFEFDKFFGFNEYQVLQFSIFYFMHHKLWFSLAHVRLSQNWLELLTVTGLIEYIPPRDHITVYCQ